MEKFERAKNLFLSGLASFDKGLYSEAEGYFLGAVEIIPDRVSSLTNLAATQIKLKKYVEASKNLEKALLLEPGNAEGFLNLGIAIKYQCDLHRALSSFDKAIELNPEYAEAWSNRGNTLHELQRFDDALKSHQTAIKINPNYAEAYSNEGLTQHKLRNYRQALCSFDKAIELKPEYAEAWSNRGNTLHELQCFDDALKSHQTALRLNPNYAEGHFNYGLTLDAVNRYFDALGSYLQAYRIDPEIDYLLGTIIYSYLQVGFWENFSQNLEKLVEKIEFGKESIAPFGFLALHDSPELQLKVAKSWVDSHCPPQKKYSEFSKNSHEKIRIGYFSADFCSHAISYLMAEIFELHDRNRFEIFAFSLRKPDGFDPMRLRLMEAFDHFYEVEEKTDSEIAEFSRSLEIDVAVDLGGHTQYSRMNVFSNRAAPIQLNFLGYPGTSGAPYMDYIVADKNLIPPKEAEFYSEKVIYLPDCFQPNDSKRSTYEGHLSRKDVGLPEDGFIYCCFNNSCKINSKIFSLWMDILRETSDTYLWLLSNGVVFDENLLKEAQRQGIDKSRIIFSERTNQSKYLAKYLLPDLFLDTLPFNAGTTASDALWMGLPVLTQAGRSYAGRMASSLLNAIGLPELITHSSDEYKKVAIGIAATPDLLRGIRTKLKASRLDESLFKSSSYIKNLENAYEHIYKRYQSGGPPEDIHV